MLTDENKTKSLTCISGCVKCFVKTKEVRIRTKHGESLATLDMELNRQVEIYISNSRTRIKRASTRAAAERSKNESSQENSSLSLLDDSFSQGASNVWMCKR